MGLIVAPTEMPLTIYQGATFRKRFIWRSGPTIAEAELVDLTDCVSRAYVREKYDSPEPLAKMMTENGLIVLGGAAATIDLHLPPSMTSAIPYLKRGAVWDQEIEWPDGDVCRLFYGPVTISPEVTYD